MRALAFFTVSRSFHFAAVEGTRSTPVLIDRNKLDSIGFEDVPALMDWYETNFQSLIDRLKPDALAYRMTMKPSKQQQFTSDFPYGVLNLIAYRKGLQLTPWIPQNFTSSRLSLPKGTNLLKACSEFFGDQPPYWNDQAKNTVLSAWFLLP